MKKYELTAASKTFAHPITDREVTVYRIKALKDFTLMNGKEVKVGDVGGWVESEANLSQKGLCWVYDECTMFDQAERTDNAIGYENAWQYEASRQYGKSRQYGESRQWGESRQYGDFKHSFGKHSSFSSQGEMSASNILLEFTNQGDALRTINYDPKTKLVTVGCFVGTIKEFEKAVQEKYKDKASNYYQTLKMLKALEDEK